MVIRTGFDTAKGRLVRSILYPPPVDFKFEQDSYKFIGILACIAGIGIAYTVFTKLMRGVPTSQILLSALDLITILVPPALPAAMSVGRMGEAFLTVQIGIFTFEIFTKNNFTR